MAVPETEQPPTSPERAVAQPATKGKPARDRARSTTKTAAAARRPAGKPRIWMRIWGVAAGLVVVIIGLLVAGVATGLLGSHGPSHVLATPDKLGAYVRRPQLEQQMNAKQLQRQVIARSAGQASNVVSGVYENNSTAGNASPQMFLLIGGNLSGTSASDFISSFRSEFKGAAVTGAGPVGGVAACVNAQSSVPGSVALCVWADNDTFGVLASPTMHAAQLGAQLRTIRPEVEHVAR
ncbi:MAG: hypothetical protein LBI49_04295 [Nocardiopsaceae bacterium]|nr:hypothetical protein [Nocardiopsaceae bacterium]